MHKKFFFYLFFLLPLAAHATIYYRHIPFTMEINDQDKIVVDYDFTLQKAIRCTSSHDHFKIDFTYKGHEKTAFLPVILESDHVPKANEINDELADVSNQFTLMYTKSSKDKLDVHCDYVMP